jgi:hypothetical protein
VLIAALTVAAMAMVLAGTLYPVPEPPKNWLPYLFLLYLAAAIGWHAWQGRETEAALESNETIGSE